MYTLWAALAALPFGWGVGLLVACLLMPGDVGQMPAVTIPIAIAGGLIFALLPLVNARTRLRVLLIGAALSFAIAPVMM